MRTRSVTRAMLTLLLLAGALFGISAKCLEHDRLVMWFDGTWHIYGEIHNETDVQGLDMALNGAVFDGGAQIGIGQAIMCPSSLSPGTFSVYDIGIVLPTGAHPDAHKVTVASGKATSERLAALPGTFQDIKATVYQDVRLGYSTTFLLPESERRGVLLGQPFPQFQYCVAVYASNGDVIGLIPPQQVGAVQDVQLTSTTSTDPPDRLVNTVTVSTEATHIRFLLWRVTLEGVPESAVAVSAPIAIVRP